MTTPSLKFLPPGFQRIGNKTMHVLKIPGLNRKGPHIALIHGIAATASSWLPLIYCLKKDARDFLILDIPAHGLSPDPALPFSCFDAYSCVKNCLLKNLSPEDNNLIIGNSLGGAFAIKFALENKDYADKCVFISPAGAPFPGPVHDVIDTFCVSSMDEARDVIDLIWTVPNKAAYSLAPVIYHTAQKPAFRSLMASITDLDDNPNCPLKNLIFTPECLKSLEMPSLLVWGNHDRILPRQMRDYFDEFLPKSTTRLFPDAYGHCPQFEHPRQLASDIRKWLATCLK